MADRSAAAGGGDGGGKGGGRTVYAHTADAVNAVLERLVANDPDCTSVVLTLGPPYMALAELLAKALRINTVLTSLKLELEHEGDIDEIVGDGGPIELALNSNGYLTVVEVTGTAVPTLWREYVRRNSCLEIPAPPPLQQSNPDREAVDLTRVPWAKPEDDRFKALPLSDMISSGGMGVVYRVKVDGEVVAAKAPFTLINPNTFQLPIHAEARETVLKDCMRELHALRRLSGHRNIVGFRCVFTTSVQGVTFPKWICMDYAEVDLYTRICEGQVEFLPDAIGIVTGLEFIHNQGMMHRDIKPQNILVGPDGTMQVADLGFVRMWHALSGPLGPLTNVGTSIYLAPDIVEGAEYDPGRDVYAFGVTAVQMILKEEPAATHEGRMEQVERAMDAAPDFAYLFRKCCEAKSCERPSCRGLQVALEAQAARADAVQSEAARAHLARQLSVSQTERDRVARNAESEIAELTRRLAESEQQMADAAAAPRVAPSPSPPATPNTPAQDALEAAMRILNHGVGPFPPCELAVRLLRSAVAQGNPDAMCELVVCLYWGRGVHINRTEAKELLLEAVAKGSVEAAGYLVRVDPDYRRTAPPALIDAAVARWRERAEQGHADAQCHLGKCYEVGIGVIKDAAEAARLCQLSADQGCAVAQRSLGFYYNMGTGVRKNLTKAVQLYRLAADQGEAIAQNNLGWSYECGQGVRKNQVEALRLYRLSADQGHILGQYNLGRCYMEGIGVEKDLDEARRWLTLSAEQGDSHARDLLARLAPP